MSSFTEGHVHQLADSLEASGFTPGDLTTIGQGPELRMQILRLVRGDFVAVVPGTNFAPPLGARLHTVRVKYDPSRPWQEAVNAAGPNTPSDYNVRKVGELYLPTCGRNSAEEKLVEVELIMLNYLNGGGGWDKALAWGQTAGLKQTSPREVFAIGEQHPRLHKTLKVNPMYAVATTECSFDGRRQACRVWWCDSGRWAFLRWVSCFVGSDGWFVFRK